jgi:hypothetical protein
MQNRNDNFHENLSKTKPNVLETNVKTFQAQLYDCLADILYEFTFWSSFVINFSRVLDLLPTKLLYNASDASMQQLFFSNLV